MEKGFKFTDSTGNEFVLSTIKKEAKENVLTFTCIKSDTRGMGSTFSTTEKQFLKTIKLMDKI